MRKHLSTILLILVFVLGLSVLLYPTVSDFWNSRTQSKAILDYQTTLSSMQPRDLSAWLSDADAYNDRLRRIAQPLVQYSRVQGYDTCLNVTGNGVMGVVRIDKINVELPIYHGTSGDVLNVAIGHLEGSSLPVGGESTHCVLSGHRGLPGARLFSDLNKMETGDVFTLSVLDRELTYEVDQIKVIRPDQQEDLMVVDGRDYCTLVTCTPYGVNTHRLLVRGKRIDAQNPTGRIPVFADARVVDPLTVAPLIAVPLLGLAALIGWIRLKKTYV